MIVQKKLKQAGALASKAAVQNIRLGVELNVCLWPKADIQSSHGFGAN